MKIYIFAVGGTIDKIYFDKLSQYTVGPPGVKEILDDLPVTFDYSITSLMRKDSLDMTDDDRLLIKSAVDACPNSKILITHGTDTMIETARCLDACQGKSIVLTGALEPSGFKSSDAVFNIGFSLGVLTMAGEGVYIAMNGLVFNPFNVVKNREKGCFEYTDSL